MPRKTNTSIPPITWTSDLVWKLIAEVEKPVNLKVLFGIKEDSNDSKTGDRKITTYKTIANTILPEVFALDLKTAIDRTRKKVESLRVTYVRHAAALKQTGGGLKDGENPSDENSDVVFDFYIPSSGPDHDTPIEAKNLWGAITAKWPFFPNCHRIWASRPNVNPPAVTTGVGPHGCRVTFMQPPDDGLENIDPVLLAESDAACSSAMAVPATPKSQYTFGTDISNTPKTPSQKVHHGKTLSISESALEKARASIKKLHQKRSFEDSILDLQRENSKSLDTHLVEESKLKKRKILIEELKLGVWTAGEYRRKVAALEDSKAVIVKPAAHTTRSQSPLWDIEAGGELPSDQDDF